MAASLFAKIQSSFNEPVWTVKRTRGDDHPNLVDYIVLAEFDIDTGSTVRHQYPHEVPNYKADWFAENMLPEGAHNREKDCTYMILNREGKQIDEKFWINPKDSTAVAAVAKEGSSDDHQPVLFGINIVRNKADSSVRRGAVVKSMALFSRYHYTQIFKAPLDAALTKYYENPSVDVLQELFEGLNAVDLSSVPRPHLVEQRLMQRGVVMCPSASDSENQDNDKAADMTLDYLPSSWVASRTAYLFGDEMRLSIPTHLSPDDLGAANVSFLLQIFRENSMKIYNAIVTKKRVLFVGYDHAAGDVCQMVLSAVSMVAPAIPNIIRRSYPYANLTDLSFLTVDGYISGVTNPMFVTMEGTWDLLCVLDLPNRRGTAQTVDEYKLEESLKSGKNYNSPPPRPPEYTAHEPLDLRFVTNLLSALDNHVISEDWVKLQFFEYTLSLVLQAKDDFHFNHFHERRMDNSIRARYEANKCRVRLLKQCSEYLAMPSNPWVWAAEDPEAGAAAGRVQLGRTDSRSDIGFVDGDILLSQLTRLQVESEMDETDVTAIFCLLNRGLQTEAAFQVLLLLLPVGLQGLHPLTSGLVHPSDEVRSFSVRLLQRMELYFSTRPAFANMNGYLKNAFERQVDIHEKEIHHAD